MFHPWHRFLHRHVYSREMPVELHSIHTAKRVDMAYASYQKYTPEEWFQFAKGMYLNKSWKMKTKTILLKNLFDTIDYPNCTTNQHYLVDHDYFKCFLLFRFRWMSLDHFNLFHRYLISLSISRLYRLLNLGNFPTSTHV